MVAQNAVLKKHQAGREATLSVDVTGITMVKELCMLFTAKKIMNHFIK